MKKILSICMSICLIFEILFFNQYSINVYATDAKSNLSKQMVTYSSSTDSVEQQIPNAKVSTYTMTDYKGKGTITFSFDEKQLANSANIYNHSLARFAIACSTLVYDSSTTRVRKVLKGLGFTNEKSVPDSNGNTSPYWICHKKIYLNGKRTEVLLVAVRGTDNEEWLDNFDSGTGTVHEGFQRAANFVYDGIVNYISMNSAFEKDSDLKILLTGHSRGAATANLLGKKIIDDGLKSSDGSLNLSISSSNFFAYTYATPNTTSDSVKVSEKYKNIYNIVNPEDFVTKVLPYKWGYRRYGTTYVLPSKTTDNKYLKIGNHVNYSLYLKSIKKLFQEYVPDKSYEPYSNGMTTISEYVDKVTSFVTDIKQYYKKDLGSVSSSGSYSLHNLYKYTLGGALCNNPQYQSLFIAYLVNIGAGQFGSIGKSTLSYFIINQGINPLFEYAHMPETYLAGMNTLSEVELKQERKILKGIVNCPVDVEIKDSDGNIISRIKNNEVDSSIDGSVEMTVDGDSKVFYIPYNDECTISLIGNDTGSMDYSLCEIDPDTGEISRVNYPDVPVEKGEEYIQEIEAASTTANLELINAQDHTTISGSIYDESFTNPLSVNITVEGVGSAPSLSNLTPGDYVTLHATTDKNNIFYGWYSSDGTLISENSEYSFSIMENKSYIAKFSNVVVDASGICISNRDITIKAGKDYYLDATVLPSNATDQTIQYTSSDETVAQVSDQGIVYALSNGETTITLQNSNGYKETCNVVVYGKEYKECNTRDEAILYTREQLVSREEEIKIKLHTSYNENTIQSICDDIINTAFTEVTDNPKEGDYLKYNIYGYNCSYMNGEENILLITYSVSFYTNLEEENDVDEKVDAIMNSLNLTDKTDFEKIKAIYDWICNNVSYDFNNLDDDNYLLKYSTYGSLVLGNSVCQGYASLLYRLLKEAGIENRVISGIGNNSRHAWNIVRLDGLYYNIDPTWDAGFTMYNWFMKSDLSFDCHTRDDCYKTNEFNTFYPMSTKDYSAICEHQVVIDPEKAVTCTEDGMTEGSHCSKCSTVINEQLIIKATGHNWDSGRVTIEPTTESTGVRTYNCQSCDANKTETIAKLSDPDTPEPEIPSEPPVPISTVDDLLHMTSDHSYILMNDLDLTGVSYSEDCYVSISNSNYITPYHNVTNYFNNVFDGNGHTIYNMQSSLFYGLGKNGVIKNLHFKFKYQAFQRVYTSIVICNAGLIENCSVTFVMDHTVQSDSNSGLSIKYTPNNFYQGIFKNVLFTLDIDLKSNVTDTTVVIGATNEGTIINCEFNGHIKCEKMELSGGIIQYSNSGIILKCDNNVNVTSSTMMEFGGITKYNTGTIAYCINRSNITTDKATGCGNIGGITSENAGLLSRCTNYGTISVEDMSQDSIATIAGSIFATSIIEYCINEGNLIIPDYGNAILVGEALFRGTFDENDQFCSMNNLSVWKNEDRSNSGRALYGLSFENYYENPSFYRKCRSQKEDLLPYEYIELPVGEYLSIPISEEYTGEVHFLEITYHDNRDSYYSDRVLCTTSGQVGVESVSYYNAWGGGTFKTIYAYTDDGKYDCLIVRLSDDCEKVTYNKHLIIDGFSKCVFVHEDEDESCNHQIVKMTGKEATCTETGLTEGKCCSVCNKVLVDQEVVPANGHTEVEDYAKAPTCTKTGLTAGIHCSVCKKVLVAQQVIPATGNHKWDEGKVTGGKTVYTCTVCKGTKTTAFSDVKVKNITIVGLSHNVSAGKKLKLTASVFPKNVVNKKIVWSSSDKKVATVNKNGVVTVLKKTGGKSVIITAEAADRSGTKATFKIISKKGIVRKVFISGKKTLSVGKSIKLKASVKATAGAYKAVKWTSSKTEYATVSSKGVVKALKAGKGKTVTITAMAMDGSGKKSTIKIKIK